MYLKWSEQKITDWSEANIERQYERGFVFTRLGKGVMQQTRSLRINLDGFRFSSENRRIEKKIGSQIGFSSMSIQYLPLATYDWHIGKMGKDFYADRNAQFSANKIKSLLTDKKSSNFNALYSFGSILRWLGYAVCFETKNIFHYAYPFYDRTLPKDMGLAMIIGAIRWNRSNKKKYFYLGSAQRPTDTYKLQFAGIEWFDGNSWSKNIDELKRILKA